MNSPTWVPTGWSIFLRLWVFLVLAGACARLGERPALAGHPRGADLLLGLTALIAILFWPSVAALGARAVLAARDPEWRFGRAFLRSLTACHAVLPYLGAATCALALHGDAPRITALFVLYLVVAAALGCLLARGVAPWGEPAATRFVTRVGVLIACCGLVLARVWQPELSLIPLFEPTMHLVFPFEKAELGKPPTPRPTLPAPRIRVPPVVPTDSAVGVMGGLALITLFATGLVWRTRPAAGPPDRDSALADLWPPVLAFAGVLAVVVLNAAYLPAINGRPRAFALAGDETTLLVALALVLPALERACPGVAFWPATGAAAALAASATLALEEVRVHHLPTTFATLASVLAFTVLGAAASRARSRTAPESAWAAWLTGAAITALALVLTDCLLQKFEMFESVRMWEIFTACWVVTKVTLTALILFVASMLPNWAES